MRRFTVYTQTHETPQFHEIKDKDTKRLRAFFFAYSSVWPLLASRLAAHTHYHHHHYHHYQKRQKTNQGKQQNKKKIILQKQL